MLATHKLMLYRLPAHLAWRADAAAAASSDITMFVFECVCVCALARARVGFNECLDKSISGEGNSLPPARK